MSIRKHVRSALLGIDRRLGLRSWLANGDERVANLLPADPFTATPELSNPRAKTVIDVGGSHGQFAREAFRVFPGAVIYSFEPIPECYKELQTLAQSHPELKPFRLALSDEPGESRFFVSRFRDSSSLQPMLSSHVEAFPGTETEKEIVVKLAKLDDVARDLELVPPVFAKLDVQGHELATIRGGRETLSQCQRVMIEFNFAPLYEGQPSFSELYEEMKSLGFLFNGFIGHLRNNRTGELLSADAVFYKPADSLGLC